MKKHLLFLLLVLFSAFAVNAQTTVIEAKQVKAVDSLKLKADWITNIIKDSSLSGATVRNFPSTDAVVKYIANRLAHTVKYTDTAAIISGYVRELRFLDSLSAIQTRIQGKLTKSDADTYYPAIQRMIDSLTAVQTRIQDKLTKSDADTYYPAIQRMNDSLSAVQTRIQSKLTKSDADTYYPAIQRMNDSLTDVQTRIQSKLTKSDADTYYPAIQRMIDSLTAAQTRIQSKLTKSDADTYYPAIQRMIDSLTAAQTRIQGKLTKSDADTYYPAIQRVLDSLTAMQSRIQTKQPLLGYTAENSANKATDFSTVNNVLYPTVQAVSTYIQSALTGVLKDRGNYDASGNTFPASGGSGSGGAIKTGDMWYISVGGTLGGKAVTAGAWVRSLTDAPGQTAGNWAIADGGFGFVPENVANKSTNTSLGTSNTAYPSQNAVKSYVDNATANASNWNTAYNKRPSSASISSSTFTLTLGDGTTVTASIPTFNQNTSGNAATATTASNWGVVPNSLNSPAETSLLDKLIGISSANGYAYKFTAGAVQSWLGLGSNAYTSTSFLPLTGGTITAGNGNQLLLDNTGQRYTQLSFKHNGTQTSAMWWDNNTSEFVLFGGFSSGGDIKINSASGAVSSVTTITAGTYFSLGGRTTSYAYRLPDWQIYNSTGGGFVVSDYANDIFTLTSTNLTITTDLNASGQGRFKGWYSAGSGLALEVGVASGAGNIIAFNRTSSTYANINIGGVDVNLVQQGGAITVNGLFRPNTNYAADLGSSSFRFSSIYAYDANLVSAINASAFIKSGGTSSQFLKADGSTDSNSYQLGITINPYGYSISTTSATPSTNIIGGTSNTLGTPAGWMMIVISGTTYYVPYFSGITPLGPA